MSRAFGFSTDLYNCYAVNAPYLEDYFYLKGSVRKDLCLSYRRKLKDYVNSDEFNFYDVAGSILQQRAEIEQYDEAHYKQDLQLIRKSAL